VDAVGGVDELGPERPLLESKPVSGEMTLKMRLRKNGSAEGS
jgi:hypothetical protein